MNCINLGTKERMAFLVVALADERVLREDQCDNQTCGVDKQIQKQEDKLAFK
jgi:hypothetical protein